MAGETPPPPPPPHDPALAALLGETIRDNNQDEALGRELLADQKRRTEVLKDDSERDHSLASYRAQQDVDQHRQLLEVLRDGPARTKRDTLEAWLGAMPRTTTIRQAEQLCTERWALLERLAPVQQAK
jgi:hypothetical protein